jgi:hypothetical protein
VNQNLGREQSIVWLEDIECLDYVREIWEWCLRGTDVPLDCQPSCRVVGYAVPSKDRCLRRLFILENWDRGGTDDRCETPCRTGMPADGVDPRTVAVGVRGSGTARSWGYQALRTQIGKRRKA